MPHFGRTIFRSMEWKKRGSSQRRYCGGRDSFKRKVCGDMFRLLSVGIGTVSASVLILPLLIVLKKAIWRKMPFRKWLLIVLFAVYAAAVCTAVGLPGINELTVDLSINFIPLIDILDSPLDYLKNTVLNILLFVPVGFMLPEIWKSMRSLKKTVFTGMIMSLTVEILQIFTFRLTDVDDLITNSLGTLLGFLAAAAIGQKHTKWAGEEEASSQTAKGRRTEISKNSRSDEGSQGSGGDMACISTNREEQKNVSGERKELLIICGIVLISMFLVKPFVAEGFWEWIWN